MKHAELSERVIAAFYHVYNTLGWGFLEKVYHRALHHELLKRGIAVQSKVKIDVFYDGIVVGEYFPDLTVENVLILEIKAAEQITTSNEAQLLNYLKSSDIEVGLILNFGPTPQIRRKVFETARRRPNPPIASAHSETDFEDP